MTDDHNARRDVDGDGDPLPADVTAELASWADSDPPAGFADRVVLATRRTQPAPPPARRRRPLGALIAVVAAVAAALVLLRGSGGSPEEGARVVRDRETIALGRRGVAVAEPGAELTWTISATGAAEVHQVRGDVFYRVEPGGPFAVDTPHGRVIVRGTCFRVEVEDMKVSRQTWIGGVVGAAVAATVVIAVYEGRVRVVNARGQADARAGERIALAAGAAPARLDPAAARPTVAAVEPPPPDSATVAELLRRDQSHRGEIALLRARVRALETPGAASAEAPAIERREGERKIVDLSQDELAAMARKCEIRFDIPGYGIEPRKMTDKLAAAEALSAGDRAIYDQTVGRESAAYMAALRALHQELVGGDGGDNLDAHALMVEIMQKSPSADVEAARKRIAEERAGLAAPPADPRTASVVERLFRLQTSAGDALEQRLAAELGPEKAHRIRTDGWAGGDDNILYGCPD
jgi:hypothetical protein